MKKIILIIMLILFSCGDSSGSRIGAICKDGWRSYSTGQGTCSHHGGVSSWLYK